MRLGKLLFVLTDGGRARFVERSRESGAFTTVAEIDNAERLRQLRGELRASLPARTFNSVGGARHAVGRDDYVRLAKEAFMAEVADSAAEAVQADGREGIVLAAPSRLVAALRARIDGRVPIAGVIRKDLTKTPDHELDAWLGEAASFGWRATA